MARTTRQSTTPLWWGNALKTWELSVAAPQVVAHRMMRMAMAGSSPSLRDRKEFSRMGEEKVEAFGESLMAMSTAMFLTGQELALQSVRQWWSMWGGAGFDMSDTYHKVLSKGLAPVHRRATANARRLGRTARR